MYQIPPVRMTVSPAAMYQIPPARMTVSPAAMYQIPPVRMTLSPAAKTINDVSDSTIEDDSVCGGGDVSDSTSEDDSVSGGDVSDSTSEDDSVSVASDVSDSTSEDDIISGGDVSDSTSENDVVSGGKDDTNDVSDSTIEDDSVCAAAMYQIPPVRMTVSPAAMYQIPPARMTVSPAAMYQIPPVRMTLSPAAKTMISDSTSEDDIVSGGKDDSNDVSDSTIEDDSVSGGDVSDSTNSTSEDDSVSGGDVSDSTSEDDVVSGGKDDTNDVSDSTIEDDSVSGGDVSDSTSEDDSVSGGDVSDSTSEDDSVSGGDVSDSTKDDSVSGGDVSDSTSEDDSVSGGDVSDSTNEDDSVSGGDVSDSTSEDDSVSGGDVSDSTSEDDSVSGGDVSDSTSEDDSVSGGDVSDSTSEDDIVSGGGGMMYQIPPARMTVSPAAMYQIPPARMTVSPVAMYQIPPARMTVSPVEMYQIPPARMTVSPAAMYQIPPARMTVSPVAMYQIPPARMTVSPVAIEDDSVSGGDVSDSTSEDDSVSGGDVSDSTSEDDGVSGGDVSDSTSEDDSVSGGDVSDSASENDVVSEIDFCDPNPCQNGATCKEGDDSFICICAPGFIGRICDITTSVCMVYGDPHHKTLDGFHHHFQGWCRYTLAKDLGLDADFNIEVQNEPLEFIPSASVAKEVYLDAYGYRVGILQGKTVKIGDEVATLPFSLADGKIRAKRRGRFVKIETDLGVALSYDGYHYAEVVVPSNYQNRVGGLCAMQCQANSTFSSCASACPATCSDRNAPNNCAHKCEEGCECDPGFVLSGQDCVPEEQCGCTNSNGRYFVLGDKWAEDGQECICEEGNTITCELDRCLDVDCGSKKEECVNVPGGYECQCREPYKELGGKCRGFLTYTVATRMLANDFYDELYDSNSKEFRNLVQELRSVLRDLYAEGTLTKDEFLDMDIRTFLPGSIIAHYKIFLPDDSPLFQRAGDDVPYILQETLKERVKARNGTHLLIEHERGHQVSDHDECASPEDNTCSPFATCHNTVGSFTCACLDGFEDRSADYEDPPGHVCKEVVMPPSPAVWSVLAVGLGLVAAVLMILAWRIRLGRAEKPKDVEGFKSVSAATTRLMTPNTAEVVTEEA
uniref:Uncharacterized protein n=1 Tax=Branchiostoma floridae TaxID=7739 RepID=C3ZTC6_BRAFL|eukprot:XP_002588162.1 hypothetical protein BRAFLDRAFT_68800 [Branchiostoma floridae]